MSETHDPVVMTGKLTLNQLFPGDENAHIRNAILTNGIYTHTARSGYRKELHVQVLPSADGEHRVMGIATKAHPRDNSGMMTSVVARSPGAAYDFVSILEDFQRKTLNRSTYVQLLWEVYGNHGLVNNAINKQASLTASKGEFLVRRAKKGKRQNALAQAKEVLYQWSRRVNAPSLSETGGGSSAVITGARGLQAISRHAARVALVEGSWVARHSWQTVDLGVEGRFDLPITIQTISTANLEPVQELSDTVVEYFYWIPPANLLNQLRNPQSKEIRDFLKRLMPKEESKTLLRENRVPLDPDMLLHVKYRGRDGQPFGESQIQAAISALAYEQSILRLDVVSMQNIINRLTIVMIGSEDKESPYYPEAVQIARASLMESFFEDPGPNMTIVWAGPDVEVKDVGAHSVVLDLNKRLEIARGYVKDALGMPDALLSGNSTDGKAAGWAAAIASQAQVAELPAQLENIWTALGEQILLENGFTDIDMQYRFENPLMDRQQERMMARQEYITGYRSIRSSLIAAGLDPDLEFEQRCFEKDLDPENTTWAEVFTPIEGVQGEGLPGAGRAPDDSTGKTTPERAPESKSPTENK